MRASQSPVIKDLVLIGGGHSHVIVLKKFGMQALAGVRITVISRELQSPYSGMLPGYIAGHYSFDDIHIDLLRLCRFAGARFFHEEVVGLDTERKLILCKNRPPQSYDVLSIDIGSSPWLPTGMETSESHLAVKPIDGFLDKWHSSLERLIAVEVPRRVGVIGAGAAGVELVLAIQHRLKNEFKKNKKDIGLLQFHLFSDSEGILPDYMPRLRHKFQNVLNKRGITFHGGAQVSSLSQGILEFENGETFQLDETFWTTSARGQDWPAAASLEVDESGFIEVNDTLESVSHAGVFASGDIANVNEHPRPKAGVFAVRQGPVLFENLQRKLQSQPLKGFQPQKEFLSLISTGNKYAVASRSGRTLGGWLIWQWKNRIDRRFMTRFKNLPSMDMAQSMRCAGCGGKVAATILEDVLAQLRVNRADNVLIDFQGPDDAAVLSVPANQVLVQSVDYFRSFVDDPYLFGQIAANHSLNDLFAMGASAHSAQAIVNLPAGDEEKVKEELLQMMQGAVLVFSEAQASLIGGHSGEASDVSLGFAVNGLVEADKILHKQGLQAGDKIIISKPLGTGTLLAADMHQQARATWIDQAIICMLQSNKQAATCFVEHDAHACTDISGFGLLGHLLEMKGETPARLEIDLNKLPHLQSCLETFSANIVSSIHSSNQLTEAAIENKDSVAEHKFYPLLFDPQTAGGLIASVPADGAEACLLALKLQGYQHAAIIAEIKSASGTDKPVHLLV
ncbi:MAG: selenide, water dikinase SelD [Gammaproteobacteria bacterium]|nr:selenide, water dikinase SelD [Gammaproteobacteria bacterium]